MPTEGKHENREKTRKTKPESVIDASNSHNGGALPRTLTTVLRRVKQKVPTMLK